VTNNLTHKQASHQIINKLILCYVIYVSLRTMTQKRTNFEKSYSLNIYLLKTNLKLIKIKLNSMSDQNKRLKQLENSLKTELKVSII
jgi:hypothetical protein